MKFFNSILLCILLFNANIIHALKPGAKKTTTTSSQSARTRQPAKKPTRAQKTPARQQIPSADSYVSALNSIRNNMTSDFVIKNNALTQEFIVFVMALNLSDIETRALLEAGVNLHATWSNDNETTKNRLIEFNKTIQSIVPLQQSKQLQQNVPIKLVTSEKPAQPTISKQTPQSTQIKSITQATLTSLPPKNHLAINNAIVILDPEKSETEGGAMTTAMLIALYQQAAPMIITSNLLESIINIQQKLGAIDMQKIRQAPSQHEMLILALNISTSHKLFDTKPFALQLMSCLNLNDDNINYYFHKSEELILLIPKKFISTNLTNAEQLSLDEQARACGFNPDIIKPLTHATSENLKKELKIQQSLSIEPESFVHNLATMFAPQKKDGLLISPEQDIKWAIYLTGHGGPAQSIGKLRQQLKKDTESLKFWQGILKSQPNNLEAKKFVSFFNTPTKNITNLLQGKTSLPDSQILPESAHISGIKANHFSKLMKYFDTNLNMGYLHYSTCFAGGSNQSFINETVSSLNVNFIISAEGLDESSTRLSPRYDLVDHEPRIKISNPSYTDFFRLINLFITDPELFVKIKQKKQDPIINIIRTLTPEDVQENQPFVRFPATSSFQGISLSKYTKVLTQTMVQAHDIENKPIDMSSPAIETIVINTPRVTTQLKLGKKRNPDFEKRIYIHHVAIVIPSPKNISSTYESVQVFKDISYEDSLQSFLFNCIYRNARLYTQTFVINRLTGILYKESNLPAQQNSTINNLIIQMKGIVGTNELIFEQPIVQQKQLRPEDIKHGAIGMNVSVIFELNNNIYELMFAISDFEKPEDIYRGMQSIAFTSTAFISKPQQSTNIQSLAGKILTPQEISEVKKPITLESIAQFIDSKIDKQSSSMALWSETNKESLLKSVTKKTGIQK